MATFFIVWNEARNEGFITDDAADAQSAVTGRPNYDLGYPSSSTVGSAFREAYEDDTLSIEQVELPAQVSA